MTDFYEALDAARFIEVGADVRYWEDATVNGDEDSEGKIPLRSGNSWCPVIELETGRVVDWPAGTSADIHYKVCDAGEYWLLSQDRKRVAKWRGHYVPNNILCVGDNGFGDYIIFKIGPDGLVADWVSPTLNADEWRSEGGTHG